MAQMDTDLSIALSLSQEEIESSPSLRVGYDPANQKWEVIVRYHGDLLAVARQLGATPPEFLTEQYAIMQLSPAQVEAALTFSEVEYLEKPKGLLLNAAFPLQDACIEPIRSLPNVSLYGEGTLVAILDSGIDYTHPDFITDDGRSRIVYLWDQTGGTQPPPPGFQQGSLYTQELLTAALHDPSLAPTRDPIGHGTHVAGIAAGNGRAGLSSASGGLSAENAAATRPAPGLPSFANRAYVGVAPLAELIVVRLADSNGYGFSKTTSLMRALQFVVDAGNQLGKPVAINMSLGTNDGGHDGFSLFETYIDDMATRGRTSIVVAAGNQGNARFHSAVRLGTAESRIVEFRAGPLQPSLSIQLWKNFTDDVTLSLTAPSGRSTGQITPGPVFHTVLDRSEIAVYYSPPSPYTASSSILVEFSGSPLASGQWQLTLQAGQIVDGQCNLWMTASEATRGQTYFITPSEETTITLPSTTFRPIGVAAYNSGNGAIASFSGRGYTRTDNAIKPDLAAPGVDITSCWPGGRYQTLSGTSMAAPFVTGCTALLMEWGIVRGNDVFLYGQRLKAYLQKGARRPAGRTYPNPDFGYGQLCLSGSLEAAAESFQAAEPIIPVSAQAPETCQDLQNSEDYLDIITDIPELPGLENQCRIPLGTGQFLNFYHLPPGSSPAAAYSYFSLRQLPVIYSPAADFSNQLALESTGSASLARRPFNPLTGSGVLIAVIDSGIDYRHPAFRRSDGSTTIASVWDQAADRVYTREDIQAALDSGSPLPLTDPTGHGTYVAGIAAGQPDPASGFSGAATGSEIVAVKLRPAKNNLRQFYGIPADAAAYSSPDVILGIQYALALTGQLRRPLVLLLPLATNIGAHNGSDPVEQYLGRLANASGLGIVVPAGNEGTAGKHYSGILTDEDIVEFFVAEGERSVLLYLWGSNPDTFSLSLDSPLGTSLERLPRAAIRLNAYQFPRETSRASIRYYDQGAPCAMVRIDLPTPGLWRLHVYGDAIVTGPYDIWLPVQNFSKAETRFLKPDPAITVTMPGTQARTLTVGGFQPRTGSIYESTGRGPNRDGLLRPSLVAPAVDVYGPVGDSYRAMAGTSAAAALGAGAAAQFLQYGLVQGNQPEMNTLTIQANMLRCAARRLGIDYPNNQWGFGTLDISTCI